MKFCSECGDTVIQKIPKGDNRLRYVCPSCETIHYQNPNVVAGVLPLVIDTDGVEKVLLCKRAIEPRYGFWTLPAGFMENQESIEQAAARESMEEANATFKHIQLYITMSMPHINQVYMMFVGQAENDFSPGIESLETQLYTREEIPWDELAFPVIKQTLEHYFADRDKFITQGVDSYDENTVLNFTQFPVHNLVFQTKK